MIALVTGQGELSAHGEGQSVARWSCFWAVDEKVASAQGALEACGASGVSGVSEATLQGGL